MSAHVAILMGSFNGEKFLHQQLESFRHQTHQDWKLYVSDDGSSDGTLKILQSYLAKWGPEKIQILPGPRQGLSQNFRSLIKNPDITADFFAFSDQDDIWHSDKLELAVKWLSSQDSSRPALYCHRLKLIDGQGHPIGLSQNNPRPATFRNALVENVASGNASVMNHAARDLLNQYMTTALVIHDWATYILVTAIGGKVFFDPTPHVDYRQHGSNIIGVPTGLRALGLRINRLLNGTLGDWHTEHIAMLMPLAAQMPRAEAKTFRHFQRMHQNNGFMQIFHLFMAGLYRQTLVGQVGLWLAALLAKN